MHVVTLLRKPLAKGCSITSNSLTYGTGGINIDGCLIKSDGGHQVHSVVARATTLTGDTRTGAALGMYAPGSIYTPTNRPGRFPANLILTESVAQLLDDSALWVHSAGSEQPPQEKYARDVMPGITGCGGGGRPNGARIGDSGGPSRFFKLVRLGVS